MYGLDEMLSGMTGVISHTAHQVLNLIPVRCEICGSWGHSSIGHQWICDHCLSQICRAHSLKEAFRPSSKRLGVGARLAGTVQFDLFA